MFHTFTSIGKRGRRGAGDLKGCSRLKGCSDHIVVPIPQAYPRHLTLLRPKNREFCKLVNKLKGEKFEPVVVVEV